MGQAAVLPDPLDEPAPIGNADDLLAQLAGEEIDRLLAESEQDAPTSPPQSHPSDNVPSDSSDVDLRTLAEGANEESLAAPVVAKAEPPATVVQTPRPPQAPAPVEPHPAPERAALLGDASSRPIAGQRDDDTLPWYLKPLEWLNRPMTLLPQRAREVLGKVAILTLFNAIAVLIYVSLFRKR